MVEKDFSEGAKQLLGAVNVAHYSSILEVNPMLLAQQYQFLITDRDGVLGPHSKAMYRESLDWLSEAGTAFEKGVAILSNNTRLDDKNLPLGVSYSPATIWRPHHFKPSPYGVKKILRDNDVLPQETLALGDGCTDLIAYRLAGITQLGMVASQGAHPIQELVHRHLYASIAIPLGAKALSVFATGSK